MLFLTTCMLKQIKFCMILSCLLLAVFHFLDITQMSGCLCVWMCLCMYRIIIKSAISLLVTPILTRTSLKPFSSMPTSVSLSIHLESAASLETNKWGDCLTHTNTHVRTHLKTWWHWFALLLLSCLQFSTFICASGDTKSEEMLIWFSHCLCCIRGNATGSNAASVFILTAN